MREFLDERRAAGLVGPVVGEAVVEKVTEPAVEEVLRCQPAGHSVVEGDSRPRMLSPQAEVHHGDAVREHERRQFVLAGEPGEDAVALPVVRDHELLGDARRREVPVVLGSVGTDALDEPMVVPAQREENVFSLLH